MAKYVERVARLEKWLEAAKPAFTMGTRKPNAEGMELIATLMAVQKSHPDKVNELIDDIAQNVDAFKAIRMRFRKELYPNYNVPVTVELYVGLMASKFGDVVQAMTYLHLKRCTSLKDMTINWMPNGYPGDDAMGLLWGIQKTPTDNEFMFTGNAVDCLQSVNDLYNKMYNTGGQ